MPAAETQQNEPTDWDMVKLRSSFGDSLVNQLLPDLTPRRAQIPSAATVGLVYFRVSR